MLREEKQGLARKLFGYRGRSQEEIARMAEAGYLGLVLKVYRVKNVYIRFWMWIGIAALVFGFIILILIGVSFGVRGQFGMGTFPAIMGAMMSFWTGCLHLLIRLPRECKRQLVVCEAGMISIEVLFKEKIAAIPWSACRYIDEYGLMYENAEGMHRVSVNDLQDKHELFYTVTRKMRKSIVPGGTL